MIIFDLDGTLADCEHRRYLIDPTKCNEVFFNGKHFVYGDNSNLNPISGEKWKPDWKSFYEACDKDTAIEPTVRLLRYFLLMDEEVQIWSGRCESVRTKTEEWLDAECDIWAYVNLEKYMNYKHFLKMRPEGDNTPDEILKERWLDERCKHISLNLDSGKTIKDCHDIDFVFDDRPKVVRMWRRRGIFVFDCNQSGSEF